MKNILFKLINIIFYCLDIIELITYYLFTHYRLSWNSFNGKQLLSDMNSILIKIILIWVIVALVIIIFKTVSDYRMMDNKIYLKLMISIILLIAITYIIEKASGMYFNHRMVHLYSVFRIYIPGLLIIWISFNLYGKFKSSN